MEPLGGLASRFNSAFHPQRIALGEMHAANVRHLLVALTVTARVEPRSAVIDGRMRFGCPASSLDLPPLAAEAIAKGGRYKRR